ncbi:protein Niban 1-like isoform X2 [Myxocyprinus asiaticus]|uniref:protein Niban 1-like isoform X2 n=1 Tax=Myxocyprinus asiaticus TaxID=70543 RepID=UPI0022215356|nr:protein Niban 1-like isoform X2 [Myxocyprinus asiaticus]
MGASSSLLDENKSNYIKGQVDVKFQEFAPIYRKQFSLPFLSQIQDELEQRKVEHTQLLKQRPLEAGQVLYEENVLFFDDSRKWKVRFIVVRASYVLECHESYKTFMKGVPALHRLLPTGGTIFTTEEKYMEMVDQCCPCTNNVQEDFAPPAAGMPGKFPVYLRLPYRQDYYFCFRMKKKLAKFISILSDCIRHQNKDFLRKKTCEVKAFLKALQIYRQEKGQYESWDMLIGSDVRALANLLMEDFMPYLEKELLPCLKSKKADKRRVWFATVKAAYYLVQEQLMERLDALKEECKEMVKQQGVLMRSNMDQITSSRTFLEGKLRAMVTEPAMKYCTEHVQPYLPAILEEVMVPINLGFTEARQLSESMMEQLCQDFQDADHREESIQALFRMSMANLESCYEKVSGLADHNQELQQTFNYSTKGLKDNTEIGIQQMMENAEYTFELLMRKALEDPSVNFPMAMQKAKHRVLRQFDYDSSTVRKKIFQEALISITLPSIKKHLDPSFKKELPKFQQYIFADYSNFISVENVYEDILQQILEKDVSMVVKEAASMKKYNLFTESKYNFSLSSLSSTPPGSKPSSPAHLKTPQSLCTALPPFPLLTNGLAVKKTFTNELQPAMNRAVKSPEKSSPKSESQAQPSATLCQALPAAMPVVVKFDVGENTTVLENSMDDLFVTAETVNEKTPEQTATFISTDTSAETKPKLIPKATTAKALAIVAPVVNPDPNPSSSTGGGAAFSDFANKHSVVISPVCIKTTNTTSSCSGGDAVFTAPPAGKEDNNRAAVKTEVTLDDPVTNRAGISDVSVVENKYPIAVCLSTEDAETDFLQTVHDISKVSGNQPITDPEHTSESLPLSSPEDEVKPLDCVKAIRDLVVEITEIEEVVQPCKDTGEKVPLEMFKETETIV